MEATTEKQVRTTSENVKNTATEMANDAKSAVQDTLESAHDTLDRASAQAQKDLRKVTDQTTSFVRENPGVAIAGAVGLGVLIGLTMRNRY